LALLGISSALCGYGVERGVSVISRLRDDATQSIAKDSYVAGWLGTQNLSRISS
jgi:hypothetical protein